MARDWHVAFVARGNAVLAFVGVTRSSKKRPSWRAVADTVGYCVLVFVFVPTLVAIPRWLRFEAANPFLSSELVVALFTPARGLRELLNAFEQGVHAGTIAGIIYAALVCTWAWTRGGSATRRQTFSIGALFGVAASVLMACVVIATQAVRAGQLIVPPPLAIVFEIGSGLVCGIVAAGGAFRLLAAPHPVALVDTQRQCPPDARGGARVSASQ